MGSKTVVLGAGMAGLLSAHAVACSGERTPVVITDHIPRPLHQAEIAGVHLLHDDCQIPGVPEMVVENLVLFQGKVHNVGDLSKPELLMANASYGEDVYGDSELQTSLASAEPEFTAYDFVTAFNSLLNRDMQFSSRQQFINEQRFLELCHDGASVISSIPRIHITPSWVKHRFVHVSAAPYPPIGMDWRPLAETNFILYNADGGAWSRTSRLIVPRFGDVWSTEYTNAMSAPRRGLKRIRKVVSCDQYEFPANSLLVGRTGAWKKGYLASQAFHDTLAWMERKDG